MLRYLGFRVLQAVGVLWAAFTVSFAVLFLLPSDPVSIAAGADAGTPVDAAAIEQLQARYGLDQPVAVQYWNALGNAVRGDFGMSISTGQQVTDAIAAALPSTLALAGTALVFAWCSARRSPFSRPTLGRTCFAACCSRSLRWVWPCRPSGWA